MLVIFPQTYVFHRGRLSNWLKGSNNTAIVCQDEPINIICNDYEGIRVSDAFWGRDNKIDCQVDDPLSPQSDKEMCSPIDHDYAYRKVSEVCQGYQKCSLVGSSLYFDTELCPHVKKYARIKYECREMSGMRRSMVLKRFKHKKTVS